MVPDYGMDLFSSLWDVLLTAVLSDPGAGRASPGLPDQAGFSAADVSRAEGAG